MRVFILAAAAAAIGAGGIQAQEQQVFDPGSVDAFPPPLSPPSSAPVLSFPIPLWDYTNNRASSSPARRVTGAGMEKGATYPVEYLPPGGQFIHEGVQFLLPEWETVDNDNVRADGQRIPLLVPEHVASVHLLAAGEGSGGELMMCLGS